MVTKRQKRASKYLFFSLASLFLIPSVEQLIANAMLDGGAIFLGNCMFALSIIIPIALITDASIKFYKTK